MSDVKAKVKGFRKLHGESLARLKAYMEGEAGRFGRRLQSPLST